MGWQDLLSESSGRVIAPWLGGRRIFRGSRSWYISDKLPRTFGWFCWDVTGRKVSRIEPVEPDPDYGNGWESSRGYLVGDRFVHEHVASRIEIGEVGELTQPVFFVEPGLDRFTFVSVVRDPERRCIYQQELFPLGAEDEVRRAFVDRKESVDDVKGVTPALDLAFRVATHQRQVVEERRAELERQRQEQERMEEARRSIGTGIGRRTLAAHDFTAAARAALAVGGAELLDVRDGRTPNEAVVQYKIGPRRLECVCHRDTLAIVDAGICLEDHDTHERGDTRFTLESLPAVVQQAIRERRLVVWRHVAGDEEDW